MQNMQNSLAIQEQRAAESSLLKRALIRVNQFLSLQPLHCSTLRDLMLSIGALLRDVVNCAHSHLWLFNTSDLVGVRYQKDSNLPHVSRIAPSIALHCVRNLVSEQDSTYLFNSAQPFLQGQATGSFSPQPCFSEIYNSEVDLFDGHQVRSAMSCVLFQDPSLDLCILLQMYNKTSSPFTSRDSELINLLGESLAPLFHSHLSSRLAHCSLDKLIGSSAVFSTLQSSVFCRLASTLRALSGRQKQTNLRALKRMARVVEKHYFRQFAQKRSNCEKGAFLGELCTKQQRRHLRRYFLRFQVRSCQHFWSQNQSRLSDSVLTNNQEHSVQALTLFLSRKERSSKQSLFKRWLSLYQKQSRAIEFFARTFQGFLKFNRDRFLGRSFKKLKGRKASASNLQKLFKQYKRRALRSYFKTLKMNSFEISFEQSRDSSGFTAFQKALFSILRKEQSVSKKTFLKRWAAISNAHFKAKAKQCFDDSSELSAQTKSISFYNSLFQIGASLQREVADAISLNQPLSVKALTSSLPFRAFFTSLKDFLLTKVSADVLVILLTYPSTPEASQKRALAVVFRTAPNYNSSPLNKPQSSFSELDEPAGHFASNCSQISHQLHHPRSSISSLGDLVKQMNQGPIASGRQSPILSSFLPDSDVCLTLEEDILFKALSNSTSPINPLLDSRFLLSLRRRKIQTTVGSGIALPIPDTSGTAPVGAIELYRLSGLSEPIQEKESSFLSQTAAEISSSAGLLQNLLKTCSALCRRSREQEILGELSERFSSPPAGLLSATVKRCSDQVRHLMRASSSLLIFLPLNSSTGYFYDFCENNLYHFQYAGSFLQEMLATGLPFRRFQSTSIEGTQCSEILYLPIPRSSTEYFGVLEVCNPNCSFKRLEQEITVKISTHLADYEEKLKKIAAVGENRQQKNKLNTVRQSLAIWREKVEEQKIEGGVSERERDALRLTFAAEQKEVEIDKMRLKHEAQIKRFSVIESEQSQIRGQMRRFSRDKKMKARVGGLALLKKTMHHFKQKRLTLSDGFSLWKTKVLCTKIAEAAFNKVMQLNHRHASVRLDVAVRLLSRCVKKIHRARFNAFVASLTSKRINKIERSASPLHGVNIQEPNYHRNLISVNASLPVFKKNLQLIAPQPGQALKTLQKLANP